MQLLIIDALNLIRRIYAAQERPYVQIASGISGATQQQIMHNTIQAIEQAINKMRQLTTASHAICVFDGAGDSWRHELYPEYKAGRSAMPSILATGMPAIKQAIADCGITHTEQPQQEADDVIASLASKDAAQQQQGADVGVQTADPAADSRLWAAAPLLAAPPTPRRSGGRQRRRSRLRKQRLAWVARVPAASHPFQTWQ